MTQVTQPPALANHMPIPSYQNLPIIGMAHRFLSDQPLHILHDAMLKKGGLVQLNFGPIPLYLVSSPEGFQHILRDNYRNYPKPQMIYGVAKKIARNGLLTSEGDFWLRQRRMIQPFMHRNYLAGLAGVMIDAIDEVLELWAGYADTGEQIDFGTQMARITMNVVVKSMFGQNIPISEMDAVSTAIPSILDYIGTRGFLPFLPDWMPFPGDQKFAASYAVLRQQILSIIDQRRNNESAATDLITMLINAVDDETKAQMTDDQLFDEAVTIFAAGFETTSTTLTWLWYILSLHPEVEQKLRDEIQRVLGGRVPTIEDLRQLTYTRMVICETLRIYPPAPLLPRKSTALDTIDGHPIPANANLLLFYYGLHHNPAIWENPEVFCPARFAPEAIAERSQFAWLPFSGGPRKCIGDEFAMMEAIFTVARVIQRYQVQVTTTAVEPYIGSTLRTSKPIVGRVKRWQA